MHARCASVPRPVSPSKGAGSRLCPLVPLRPGESALICLLGERAKEQCLCVWPEPLPGAPGAVPADPGMDSEGWFAVNGWKYLVKWHHSGSYQLYPGKVPRGLCALWLAGAGWLVRSSGMCAG